MKNFTLIIFNQLNIKNNKIDKYNFKKNITKKIMKKTTVVILIQRCFKEKNYKVKFPTSSEKNKFDKNNCKKTSIKKHVGKHCSKKKS